MRKWGTLLIAAAVTAAAGYPSAARAEILLSVTDGTNTLTANDLATPGLVSVSGTVGSFAITINTGFGFPYGGSPTMALIDLGSMDITTTVGGTLTVSLTETDFAPKPGTAWFESSLTGNYASSEATLSAYLDATNAPFGTGTLLASGLFDNEATAVLEGPIADPYSMTEIATITAGPNSMTSLDAMVVDAPEPGSLPLLGTALLALGTIGWRSRPRRVAARRPA